MKNFFDYLIQHNIEDEDYEEVIKWEIKERNTNPYHHSVEGDHRMHFCLTLTAAYREKGIEENWIEDISISFHWSGNHTPTKLEFSDHIYKECRAAILAVEYENNMGERRFFKGRDDITGKEVIKYLRNLGLGRIYKYTSNFVNDYYHWHDRLYATQKWVAYMSGELERDIGGYAPCIGPKMFEFLDL